MAGEQAVLCDDGWIAIARLHPYRVDWIEAGDRVLHSKPLRESVIDRESRLLAQIVAPAHQVLVGIGSAHLYAALIDDDGIQRIRRYRWPLK